METFARPQTSLIDLLDRVLDRGLVIKANVDIPLAGPSPIGINLRAAQAGMETVLNNGVIWDWDQRILAREVESAKMSQALAMAADDEIVAAHGIGARPPLQSRDPAPY